MRQQWAVWAAVLVAVAAAALAWLAVAVTYRRQRSLQLVDRGGAAAHQAVQIGERVMVLETVRERRPYIQIVRDFVSDAEIAALVALGDSKFQESTTLDRSTGQHTTHPDRTSSTCYLPGEDPIVRAVQARAAALLHVPASHSEPLQLTRYRKDQEYKPHFDYFEPGTEAHRDTDHGYLDSAGEPVPNQRVTTLFVYLTEPPPEGRACAGGTVFPECGYEVVPTKGAAVLFHNVDEIGREDPTALHGGVVNRCDDDTYTKIGLNIWFRRMPWTSMPGLSAPKHLQTVQACAPCDSVHPLVRCRRKE